MPSPERMQPLIGRGFFQRDPVVCARELLGCELNWDGCGGRIVETEAYSVVGVYLNYGMYWLLNFLVKGGAEDGFVLVRALEPTVGIERMKARRGGVAPHKLCAGPGRLGMALGLGKKAHGVDGCSGRIVELREPAGPVETECGPRIGISRSIELPWRFVVAGSPCLSAPMSVRRA
jgi:DNA-3-methyladenine glycosylase